MDLGEHRFRGHEHHRTVGGLARNDVLSRDVVDVLADVGLELPLCGRPLRLVRVAIEHAVVVLQRKLGIDRDHPGGRRKAHDAVHPGAVGERVLHLEGGARQDVPHQRLELHLAESTARALVSEQLLQAHHASRQALDLLLRLVDGGQALHHADEGVVGLLEAFLQALVDLAGDLVEPLVDLDGEPLARIGEVPAEPVALLRQPLVQVLQHLAVLLLQHRAEHRGGVAKVPLEHDQAAQHPEENDQRDDQGGESDFSHEFVRSLDQAAFALDSARCAASSEIIGSVRQKKVAPVAECIASTGAPAGMKK